MLGVFNVRRIGH